MASIVDSRLDRFKDRQINIWERGKQEKKYMILRKGLNIAMKELEQRINATSMTLKLYENQSEQSIKNRTNQRRFFEKLRKSK